MEFIVLDILLDLELPSIGSMDEDPSQGNNSGSEMATSAAQDIPGEASQVSHGVVTSPPKSLSVVSSLTDSDPPSPREPEAKAIGDTSDVSVSSSLPSSVAGLTVFTAQFLGIIL